MNVEVRRFNNKGDELPITLRRYIGCKYNYQKKIGYVNDVVRAYDDHKCEIEN